MMESTPVRHMVCVVWLCGCVSHSTNIHKTKTKPPPHPGDARARQELAAVQYERNVLGSKGPRSMAVVLPRPNAAAGAPGAPCPGGNWLIEAAKQRDERVVRFVNNPPRWNDKVWWVGGCIGVGGWGR